MVAGCTGFSTIRLYPWAMVRRIMVMLLLAASMGAGLPAGATSSPITLDVRGPVGAIPEGFLGLSVEASTMGSAAFDPSVSNMSAEMLALGPGVVTFAGSSADRSTVWQRKPDDPIPAWATATITPDKLRTVAALATATGWKVDLAINLYHDDPARAADEVVAATKILGPSLRNVHLGNEPELYTYMYRNPMSFEQYAQRWSAVRRAILARSRGTRFTGPDSYLPAWYDQLLATPRVSAGLSEFGDHFYPFSDCGKKGVRISALLSDRSLAREAAAIANDHSLADVIGIPVALDEFNSVSCGSTAPVQWQAASALWVVRALLTAASGGVVRVGIQTNVLRCQTYSPLCPSDSQTPQLLSRTPIMSGLQLVAGLEGGRLLRIRTTTGALPPGVSAWAIGMPGGGRRLVLANTTATDVADLRITGGPTRVTSMTTLAVPDLEATTVPDLVVTIPSDGILDHSKLPAQTIEVLSGQ